MNQRRMRITHHLSTVVLAFVVLALASTALSASDVHDPIQLESHQTHSRLMVHVEDSVPAVVKTSKAGFEVIFKGIGLGELGIPLGEEGSWKTKMNALNDPRLASLKLDEVEEGLKITGKWKFPAGDKALAHPEMEFFDYREKASATTSAGLILDFWHKKGPTAIEVSAAKKTFQRVTLLKNAEEGARQRAERRKTIEKVKAETQDTTRFCKLPLDDKTDIFLPFNAVHEEVDFSKWFSNSTPDRNYTYFKPKTDSKDSRYMRLALELYKQSKFGLTIRTLDFLDEEFPKTSLRPEAKFLRANTLIKLGYRKDADIILSNLLSEAKDTPPALYTAMYLSEQSLEKKDYLGALERFDWLIQNHSENRLIWVFHLGAAECLYHIKQTERAVKEYQWIEENARDGHRATEAALRIGDLYMDRFQYDQALASYFQGIQKFPKESKEFAFAFINRGEALYQLAEYDRAEIAFKEFLKNFPGHPSGWRAAFRLGEIDGRKDVTPENVQASRDWYYETINHFPLSAGAVLARLRLLPCGDHGGMTFEGAKRFFEKEAIEFPEKHEGRHEIVMAKYKDLKAISRVRSMITLGEEAVAVNIGIKEIKALGFTEGRTLLETLLGSMFRKSILNFLADGKRFEALRFYHEKSEWIPRDKRLLESDFLMRLSQAASDLHMGKLAGELMNTYLQAKSKAAQDKTLVWQKVPYNKEDMDIILEESEEAYTEAKALWVMSLEAGQLPDVEKVGKLLSQVKDESPFSYDREIILGLMAERTGKASEALSHAVKAQILAPQGSKADLMKNSRLEGWLATLEAKAGDPGVALSMYKNLETLVPQHKAASDSSDNDDSLTPPEVLGVPAVPTMGDILLGEAEIFEKQKQWTEASEVYARAVEKNVGGTKAMYGYANALLVTGKEHDKAIKLLQKLGDENDGRAPGSAGSSETPQDKKARLRNQDFWKQMARERLANEKSREQISGNSNN